MQKENLQIICKDGYAITATLYQPKTAQVSDAIMIAPATGIKRVFYHAFASHLASLGYGVITFDNRGIGDSITGKLKDSKATIRDWGYLDMPAVLETLQAHFPNTDALATKYHLIGHSAGGQLTGLMYNHTDLASIFNVACSSGQLDNMHTKFRYRAKFFMNVFAPLNNLLFGYTNTHWIGMGEPLPKGVAKDWCDWCNGEGYIKTAFGDTVTQHWYDDISCPSMWINATDDDIALDANVDDMTRVFTKMTADGNIKRLTLEPKAEGFTDIGHMKFFSSKRSKLWTLATDWLTLH